MIIAETCVGSVGTVWTYVRLEGTVWTYVHLGGIMWTCVCLVGTGSTDFADLAVSLINYPDMYGLI